MKEFQLADVGDPVADDFEGIAVAEGRIYLVTSAGRLYECREGADGASVLFQVYATGPGATARSRASRTTAAGGNWC